MSNDYTENSSSHDYSANLEMSCVYPDTMTDAGIPASDLLPIGDACLTPGDPSPLGRTEDGDLAYPVFPRDTHLFLKRADAAALALVWAKAHNLTAQPVFPVEKGSPEIMLNTLLEEALPKVFYDETSHGELARTHDIAALLSGDFSTIARHWKRQDT